MSRNGEMSNSSTEKRSPESLDQSTLFPAVSPVRTFHKLAEVPASQANAPAYGKRCSESFAKYDRASCLWRMSQLCLDGALEPYSETWPRSGTTLNGIAYRLPPSAPLINETEFGSWPTPRVGGQERYETRAKRKGHKAAMSYLESAVDFHEKNQWPTPSATPRGPHSGRKVTKGGQTVSHNTGTSFGMTLETAVKHSDGSGSLNPQWVEWLMGLPTGWTDLNCSETAKSFKSSNISGSRS